MNDIIIIAIKDEAPNLAKYRNVIFCGVGKINAAIATTEAIQFFNPKRIINFGTAGGITVGSGLHKCGQFIQRDMLCMPLGFAVGQTPFEDEVIIKTGDGLLCSSGDNFVTEKVTQGDVVDMEAFAIAKVCKKENIRFRCFKFISDEANENAKSEWIENCKKGAILFSEHAKKLFLI